MRRTPAENKELLLKALEKSLGIVTTACKTVGLHRDTFYEYLKTDEEFKKKVDDIQNIQCDFVETELFKKIREGSERSILFYMKYRGKMRGYTESVDITSDGKKLDGDIKIVYVDGNKGDESSTRNEPDK